MTDPIDTAAIRARLEAATPGPWTRGDRFRPGGLRAHEVVTSPDRPQIQMEDDEQGRADAEFIAHAPADIRALLARVAELEAEQQNGEWQYGFVNPNTGEFIHHGDENQARALATIVKRPIMRRHARFGPPTPISDTTGDQQ